MSYMKCGNCESWERCVECGWCAFCAESEKAKHLNELQRFLRIEKERNEAIDLLNQAMDGNSDLHIDLYTKIDSYIANLKD